jgi:hypothetical protein
VTIHIRNFKKYQHRDCIRSGTAMEWIKDFTGQLSDDDWLSLTYAQRGLLQSLRLEYGRSVKKGDEDTPSVFRGLTEDPAKLGRRLGQRVLKRDLAVLISLGFIQIQPATSQQPASLEERRVDKALQLPSTTDLEVDVKAQPLNPDELDARQPDEEQSSTGNVIALHEHGRVARGEVNGRPIGEVVGPILDELRARAP